MKRKVSILILIIATCSQVLFAQLSQNERKIFKSAVKLFDNEQFAEALPIFLKLDSINSDDLIKYHLGACYLNTDYEKLKALPYLEEVSNSKSLKVPIVVHSDLGTLYHYIYRFDEAIAQFQQYLKLAKKDEFAESIHMSYAERMIIICNSAKKITTQSFKADIEILGYPINTMESDFCPMITADENTMVYMHTKGLGKIEKPKTSILKTHRDLEGYWSKPDTLTIENRSRYKEKKIRLAGLSPDGRVIFLNIGSALEQDIYSGSISLDNEVVDIKKLNKNINSDFFEGRVSISPDGTELYFVSDRPGGYGRTDIYKAILNRRGEWDKPINLGSKINTKYNENSPFMHPDNQTLLFSSEGHKTIGGNDIFKSKINIGVWGEPENLGFPNSTKDDLYFVLNANGQTAYFSSSKNSIFDKHNIFKVNLQDPIPLTLVKGMIKAGDPAIPISATIAVYDKETGERVKYVYNPDPETGKYLMIFPPAKNYDLVISSEDFMSQIINIYIPYQTYFYELYQEITLKPIHVNNKQIGEEVIINNTFYDLYKTNEADSIIVENLPKKPEYYDHLLELVETIIQTTDTMRINYNNSDQNSVKEEESIDHLLALIEDAIETSNPITLSILDANAKQKDKVKSTHFYTDGLKEKSGILTIIGGDSIYTAPPIASEVSSVNSQIQVVSSVNTEEKIFFKGSSSEQRNYIHHFSIYYDVNKDDIPMESVAELQQMCKLLLNNSSLGAEIYGYADSKGKEGHNLSLSRQRAQNVLRYFIENRVNQQKLVAKGFGDKESKQAGKKDNNRYRKVDINLFELKQE